MLKKGDMAPDFELLDQNGETVRLSNYRGRKVLVYFYPKANTPGCTNQSCSVRNALSELDQSGISALGISPDTVKKQKNFDEKHGLGFPLLSDTDHTAATGYGVWGEKTVCGKKCMGITRSSFLIDEAGKLIESWYKVKPKDTVSLAFKVLESGEK